MLLSTRDVQRQRRLSVILNSPGVAERLSVVGADNASFLADSVEDLRQAIQTAQTQRSSITTVEDRVAQDDEQEAAAPTTAGRMSNAPAPKGGYRWRMTHYFYIHMVLFIINGLLCGLIVYLIENYSAARNLEIEVPYLDAWFVSSSCVYNCGLTTLDFAKLSHASQTVLMVFTFISGITISTLPALVVKAHTHRKVEGITVDDDHGHADDDLDDELPTFNIRRRRNLPQHIRDRLAQLPTAAQLRYRAYITCIALILGTCFLIYMITFFAIGGWLTTHYTPDELLQGNYSVNPWYVSFIVTVTGFNQNGLVPFSDGFARFIYDVFLNLFVMLVVICGTSLFPFLLRNVVMLVRFLSPWRYKIIFDYILLNNHRLSTLLFPAVQTRIYLLITFLLYVLGVSISLILDLHSEAFAQYPGGTRFLIFLFHTVNTRFAGFSSVSMTSFATATLLIYIVLMATKPQMLSAIDESPFELSWLAVQAREEVDAQTNPETAQMALSALPLRSPTASIVSANAGGALPMRQMEQFLRRQSFVTKDRVRQQFANTLTETGERHRPQHLRKLRLRLFLIYFVRALFKHTFSFLILTRTWLFVFIFLICAIEYQRMSPVDPNITIFAIIFEIMSAFGAVGLSLGYPNIASSFATVLSPASKTILVITMFMGRHRGLLASMKDQEAIEYNAADVINRQRDEIIFEYEQEELGVTKTNPKNTDELIVRF